MKFFCETVLYYQLNSVVFQNNSLNDSVYLKNTEYVKNYNLICLVNYFLKLKHEIRKEEKLPHHITYQEFRKETLTFFLRDLGYIVINGGNCQRKENISLSTDYK